MNGTKKLSFWYFRHQKSICSVTSLDNINMRNFIYLKRQRSWQKTSFDFHNADKFVTLTFRPLSIAVTCDGLVETTAPSSIVSLILAEYGAFWKTGGPPSRSIVTAMRASAVFSGFP